MARRFNSFQRRSGAPRRQTEWLSLDFTGVNTVAAATKLLVASLDSTELDKLPFTITRTIGLLSMRSDQTGAREMLHGALGATVVSERALTVGITALPDPVTENNADFWFLYTPWAISVEATPSGQGPMLYAFDSKAQRKVEEGDQVVFVMANQSASFGGQFTLQLRILIKLH